VLLAPEAFGINVAVALCVVGVVVVTEAAGSRCGWLW
jgi:hypothetical protein